MLEHTTTDKTAGEIRNTYTYDADNRTTSVITPMGIQALSYDKANRLIKSENSRTGSVRQIVYDQRGLPVSAITRLGDTTLSTENNVYDFMGNKVRSEENGYVREYKYDGLNRLTSVTEDTKETLYEFDVYGNIAKEHEIVGLKLNTKLYYYDKDNRLILTEKDSNVTSYEYDANGNLTHELSKYSDIHYEYDGYNRLTNVIKPNEIISYEYNAEGFRDRKYTKDGMTRFIYDSGSVSAEILPDGNVYSYYRADGIIGSIDITGNKLYYSQNTHGDVTAIYDINGIVLKDYRYSAYGKPQTIRYNGINQPYLIQWYAETNSVHNPFGYCGEYTDSETGFVYLRNRYYDPSTGRFVQEDPVRDGLNWYVYCGNNPISFIDPFGLSGEPTDTEVYLRDMFNMYKKSKKDKIDVYNNRVEVTLNNHQETYYYDTSDRRQADGNRMNDDKMIVNAVSFAEKFGITKSIREIGSDDFQFVFTNLEGDKMGNSIFIPIFANAHVSWNLGVSYVETPNNKIITSQSFYVSTSGWAIPQYEIDSPTLIAMPKVTYTQGRNIKTAPLYDVTEQIVATNVDMKINRDSTIITSFKNRTISASVEFFLFHNGASYGAIHNKKITLKF